jgi:hypothetical protein
MARIGPDVAGGEEHLKQTGSVAGDDDGGYHWR